MKRIIKILGVACCACTMSGVAHADITTNGLLLDLDANDGLEVQNGNKVVRWSNQAGSGVAQDFLVQNEGRTGFPAGTGSGRPTLIKNVSALNGNDALVFEQDELVNFEGDAFDELTTGAGFTWVAVIAAGDQPDEGPFHTNAFFGNLRNSNTPGQTSGNNNGFGGGEGGNFEGFWGGFNDDHNRITSADRRKLWGGVRSQDTIVRTDRFGAQVLTPTRNVGQFHVVAGRLGSGTRNVTHELFLDSAGNRVDSARYTVNTSDNPSFMAIGTERNAVNHPGLESFNGTIARFLIYGGPLTDNQLSNTMGALAERYFGSGGSSTPPTDPSPSTNGNVVSIKKRNAPGFSLDGGNGGSNGQNVRLWAANDKNANQKWVEINRGNGFYSYQKLGTNYCLDGDNQGARSQNIYLWACDDDNRNQHWLKSSTDSGFYKLIKRNASGFAVSGGKAGANGQNVVLWSASTSSNNLQWSID